MDFLTGKPYKYRGFNCWDYVVEIRKMHNIKTKQFKPRTLKEAFVFITAEMQKLDGDLMRVSELEDFDIIMGKTKQAGRDEYHCGLYHNGLVHHCDRIFGAVRNEPLADFVKVYEGVSFWR